MFYIDTLTLIMVCLVGFIGSVVFIFSTRYMQGEQYYFRFLWRLALLCCCVIIMLCADRLEFFFISWCFSNYLLVQLMVHQSKWKAAQASGKLAAKNFIISSICLGLSLLIFYFATGLHSIHAIIHTPLHDDMIWALIFMLIAAVSQSAIWPFHSWLLSSLNSPTPVSAIMHAGLINGGGYLLIRFSPLYLEHKHLLTAIFVLGIVTVILGTFWKLIQADNKRMLACSTMGQMGFMLVQCGLGLFPAAIAHICWHGLFKAHLFLKSGSAAQPDNIEKQMRVNLSSFILALILGIMGSYIFANISGKPWLSNDTHLILIAIAFVATTQIAMSVLSVTPFHNFIAASISIIIFSSLYGLSVGTIHDLLIPLNISKPQDLNAFYIIGLILLIISPLYLYLPNTSKLMQHIYVRALNASQPHPNTITTHRNQYE